MVIPGLKAGDCTIPRGSSNEDQKVHYISPPIGGDFVQTPIDLRSSLQMALVVYFAIRHTTEKRMIG